MTDSNSALSLTPPNPRLYETSEGEQRVLGQITPENIGGLYGLLLGQRGQAQRNQDEYEIQLNKANDLQNALANAKLRNDRRQHDQSFFGGLVQHGQLPSSVAINATGGTDTLPQFLSGSQMAQGTLRGDQLAELRTRASALEAAGKGLQSGREAGVVLDPGQKLSGPEGYLGAKSTTGNALDLDVEALRNAGDAARASAKNSGGTKVIMEWDELSQSYKTRIVGTDFASVQQTAESGRQLQNETKAKAVERRGGNYKPQGAAPVSPAAQPPPTPNSRAATVLTPEQGRATAAEVIRTNPELKGARFHSQTDTPAGTVLRFTVPGKSQPVEYRVK